MKRSTLILRLWLMLLATFCVNTIHGQVTIDGIKYELNVAQGVAQVTGAESSVTVANIPSSVTYENTECTVTKIGDSAFFLNSSLTEVNLPETVTAIGDKAFQSSDLTKITFPESLGSIGNYAFNGCDLLSKIAIPKDIRIIGDRAFQGCKALTEVTLLESEEESDSSGGSDSQLGGNSFGIGNNSGSGSGNKIVYSIGGEAFSGCTSLKTITIPPLIEEIGYSAFKNCSALTEITIPAKVTSIFLALPPFSGCSSLENINVSADNTDYSSNDGVLYDKKQTEIYFCPEGKKTVTIPSSVRYIYYSDFSNCNKLESINISTSNDAYSSIDGVVYNKKQSKLICCPRAKQTVTIPNTVTIIGNYAFQHCSALAEITIPESVTSIETSAFSGCSALTKITLPESMTGFTGTSVFRYCNSLKEIVLPNSMVSIPDYTFSDCSSLTKVSLPNSLHNIGKYAFENCRSLTEITIPESVTNIKFATFRSSALIKIIIPKSVTDIEDAAFENCTSLKEIVIPKSLKNIGEAAFHYCYSLQQIIIPNSVKSIGTNAFSGCINAMLFLYPTFNSYSFLTNEIKAVFAHESEWEKVKKSYTGPVGNVLLPYFNVSRQTYLGAVTFTIEKNSLFDGLNEVSFTSLKDAEGNDLQTTGGETYSSNHLNPETTYSFVLNYSLDGEAKEYTFTAETKKPSIRLSSKEKTQKTITFNISASEDNSLRPTEKGAELTYGSYGMVADKNSLIKFTDLHSGREYRFYPYAIYNGKKYYGESSVYTTKPISCSISTAETGTTTLTAEGKFSAGDVKVDDYGFIHDGKEYSGVKTLKLTALRPQTTYNPVFWIDTEEGRYTSSALNITTQELTFKTLPASSTSNTSSTISAETNCDAETGTGFEWRRIDAPDLVPSSYEECPVVDGVMAGSLRGLSSDTYYKYRPYYKAADGSYYYGEWIGFGTADAYVYFVPTVRTMDAEPLNATSALLTGYALAGSDDITEQGFEYRPLGSSVRTASDWQRVEADGQKMAATISDLSPATLYTFRAFATTSKETVYGEEMTFETKTATGISEIPATTDVFNISARQASERGNLQVCVSGASTSTAQCCLMNVSGTTVATASVMSDGNWQAFRAGHLASGVYLLHVTCGKDARTVKLLIK